MRKTLQVITAVVTLAVATPLPAAGLSAPPARPGTASPAITRPGPAARTGSAAPAATLPRGAGTPAPATVPSSRANIDTMRRRDVAVLKRRSPAIGSSRPVFRT